MASAKPDLPHDPYHAFRYRDYRIYSAGFALGNMGLMMQSAAVGWELYKWTGQPIALGWVGLVQMIPSFLLALPAGHLADSMDRRRLMVISQWLTLLGSVGLAVLSYAHQDQRLSTGAATWWMYGLLFAISSAQAIGRPARSSILPQLLPPSAFGNAVTWNSSIFEVTSIVGPAIGGALLVWSLPGTYVVSAIGVSALLVSSLMLRPTPVAAHEPLTLKRLVAGVRFVWNTKVILGTITLDMFAVLLGGAMALLPVYAKDILKVDEVGYGWLRAAPAAGAFTMALIQAHRPPLRRAGPAMLWAVTAYGIATIIFGFSRSFSLSMAALVLTGAFDNVSVVVRHTLVQLLTPNAMRGRVTAVNSIFIDASNKLGALESGLVAQLAGPVFSVVSGGVGTIAVVIAVALIWPAVRKLGGLRDLKPAAMKAELMEQAATT